MTEDNHAAQTARHGPLADQSAGPSAAGAASDVADEPTASPRIDRLVTGDLEEAERMELLAWLDAEPVRWRQCGLAFLEAQALREAFALDGSGTLTSVPSSARRAITNLPSWRPLFIAAAVVVIAFALGWALAHRPPDSSGDSGVAAAGDSQESSATASQLVASAGSRSGGTTTFPPPGGRVVLVRARVGEGPDAREVVLPVLAGPAVDAGWERTPGPVPDYVRRQWERQGYRVTERRQTVPLKLADGRQVELPVEQVMLTFVGQPVL
jgi:hypothetical protein